MTDVLKLEQSILNYLVMQPSAKDTFQGIAEWWIMKEQIDQSVDRISKALEKLVAEGFIVVKEFRDQERYYQLNDEKLPEIKKMITEMMKK
jgi:DNA-binding transcriptional ArsR family regulator